MHVHTHTHTRTNTPPHTQQCWHPDPDQRPGFRSIMTTLQTIADKMRLLSKTSMTDSAAAAAAAAGGGGGLGGGGVKKARVSEPSASPFASMTGTCVCVECTWHIFFKEFLVEKNWKQFCVCMCMWVGVVSCVSYVVHCMCDYCTCISTKPKALPHIPMIVPLHTPTTHTL